MAIWRKHDCYFFVPLAYLNMLGQPHKCNVSHRGYAVVCLSPVIEAVGVTSITPHTRGENYGNFPTFICSSQGLCSCLFKSCDRGGQSYKHSPHTQGKKTMENFQFSSAHHIILKATSLTNYHYYLRLACID